MNFKSTEQAIKFTTVTYDAILQNMEKVLTTFAFEKLVLKESKNPITSFSLCTIKVQNESHVSLIFHFLHV